MNKLKKSLFCILTITLWGSIMTNAISHEKNDEQKSKIKNKMTWEEARQVDQIPEVTLINMSTEKLIRAYLDSRFTGLILAYNNPQDGFDRIYNDFNGVRELLSRKDTAKKLIVYYQNMDPGAYASNWEPAKIGKFTFTFIFIEVLLAQEEVLAQLTHSEVKMLLSELLKKHELKMIHREKHSIIGLAFNAFTIARLMKSKGTQDGFFQKFLEEPGIVYLLKNGRLKNDDVLSALIQKSQEFLQSH